VAAWRRICCPVDFSPASRSAMLRAAWLAAASRAHLTLLYVAGARLARSTAVFAPPAAPGDRRRRQLLKAWMREAEAVAPGRVECAVLSGDAAERVAGFARECGFDLIVVGARGRRRLRAASLARELLRRASCSVLVVPADEAA